MFIQLIIKYYEWIIQIIIKLQKFINFYCITCQQVVLYIFSHIRLKKKQRVNNRSALMAALPELCVIVLVLVMPEKMSDLILNMTN